MQSIEEIKKKEKKKEPREKKEKQRKKHDKRKKKKELLSNEDLEKFVSIELFSPVILLYSTESLVN